MFSFFVLYPILSGNFKGSEIQKSSTHAFLGELVFPPFRQGGTKYELLPKNALVGG